MNALDYVILAVLAVLFVLCAWVAFRRRNRACGGGMDCAHCPYHANCPDKARRAERERAARRGAKK